MRGIIADAPIQSFMIGVVCVALYAVIVEVVRIPIGPRFYGFVATPAYIFHTLRHRFVSSALTLKVTGDVTEFPAKRNCLFGVRFTDWLAKTIII